MGLGGNLAAAAPDTHVTRAALTSARLTVQVSTKLNRSHVTAGRTALILPTPGRTERDLTGGREQAASVEDSMSCVHLSRGPGTGQRPVAFGGRDHLRDRRGHPRGRPGRQPDRLGRDGARLPPDQEHIARVVPGCAAYPEKAQRPGGFVLPHPPRDSRTFDTSTGKAQFSVNPLQVLRLPEGHLLLQSLRSHDQFNTTIYGHDDRYRGISGGRDVVLVHPDDLQQLGITPGDLVDIVGEGVDGSRRVVSNFRVVPYPTPRGCAAAYYPEVNPLIPLDSTAVGSNCPTSKAVVVRLTAPGETSAGPAASNAKPVGADNQCKSPVEPFHLS